jgi:predicted nucleotidyltransferase
MAWMDPLTANLLDLLVELRELPVPLTIGGGFGLYLKRMRLDETRERTLLSQLPMPRATNDLDLFVRADVLCDLQSMKAVAAALDRLGYEVVPEAKYMQWKKHFDLHGQDREIKVDLLVGPLGQFRERLHVKGVRARPIGPIKLHAHTLEEAVHIDESPVTLTISGNRSNGEPAEAQIHVPQPFTYLMMKLFAFRDRKMDEDKDLGRHHALDLYTIIAMQVESDYQESLRLGNLYAGDTHVETAREIIRSDFAEPTSIGVIRLREHPLFRPEFPVPDFLAVLSEIFHA